MKKIDKEKLKEIGKKIGIFISVVFVFLTWFLMGVRYGRNHPKNTTTARADDVVNTGYTGTYYIPLSTIDLDFVFPNNLGAYASTIFVKPQSPKTYLICQDGSSELAIGSYGSKLSDYTTFSLNLEDTSTSHFSEIEVPAVSESVSYNNMSIWYKYEVIDNGRYDDIDFSSISDYRIVGCSVTYNYFTSNLSELVSTYRKKVVEYDLNLAIGEDNTIHFKIACYPSYFYYEDAVEDTYDYYEENLSFFCKVRNTRTIQYALPFNNYSQGFYDGYASGYNSGSNSTYSQAYNQGYSKGFADGNTDGNSLRDVVRTAIETPVNMFKVILNWNFLGYNLFTLFSTIITVIVVVFIVKKLM